MKKLLVLLMVVALSAGVFVGCSSDNDTTGTDNGNGDVTTDVLVIGGGGAGLTSAIYAAKEGADVILIEKMSFLGGNSITSATGFTAADTVLHEQQGLEFTVDQHVQRTMDASKNATPDENLVRVLAEGGREATDFLLSLGLEYRVREEEPWNIVPVEGHFGSLLIAAKQAEAAKYDNLDIRLNTEGTGLIIEDGVIVGATAKGRDGKEFEIRANAVILATGGFGNAQDLIGEYNPKFANSHNVMSTAGPTGDGFRWALAAGADTRDMEFHQMRPLGRPGYWIREVVISGEGGGILLNKNAERFARECTSPLDLAPEILAQPDRVGYIIFDSETAELPLGQAAIRLGQMIEADTIEELAEKLGLDADAVVASIEDFNAGIDPFGRENPGKVTEGPFYGVEVLPSSHFTMAGIAFNENAQAIDIDGNAIEGLYIVGELSGGLYGSGRVFGNNTLENLVFGRIAAQHATR